MIVLIILLLSCVLVSCVYVISLRVSYGDSVVLKYSFNANVSPFSSFLIILMTELRPVFSSEIDSISFLESVELVM